MKKFKFNTTYKKLLADITTPVSIYLRLRDIYPNSLLLESADYHAADNSFSFVCCKPIASIKIADGLLIQQFPDGTITSEPVSSIDIVQCVAEFASRFEMSMDKKFNFVTGGLFGYMTYNTAQYFEDIQFGHHDETTAIPDLYYVVYQYIIVIDHFKDELHIFNHQYEGAAAKEEDANIEKMEYLISNKDFPQYGFKTTATEQSNFNDEEFKAIVEQGISHCHRGNVFQMVLSRRYSQSFIGDEFNVYRALRSINPSPYLFYMDYGSFKLFGSSPEAQIVIKNKEASIFPIAGTVRRSGDEDADQQLADTLLNDPKENAEHVMLVDLARNDLSRNCSNVRIEHYKEIQYFSHVIHLVSKVTGDVRENTPSFQVVANTFPAGTLSGAPKIRAMQLIDELEHSHRGYYGGCMGYMGFNGGFNHAIMIRSFFSKNNTLYYQAGAGVVEKSVSENELQEVNNKLMALRNALKMAEGIV